MVNKLILIPMLLVSFVACDGGKVQFTEPTNTRSVEYITTPDTEAKSETEGNFVRGAALGKPNKLILAGKEYFLSMYSSIEGQTFENAVPYGETVRVKVKGNIGKKETGHAPTPEQEVDVYVVATITKI